jgi:uncharacterized protein (DUF736 family)
MANIGAFTKDSKGVLRGSIHTLALNAELAV